MPFLNVKNRAESTLASGISDSDLSLTLFTGDGPKYPASNFHITIDEEILLCTSRTNDVCTVEREKEGTTAAAHIAGAKVELRITAAIVSELQTADAENVKKSGAQTVNGIKTFGSIPVLPSSDPTTANQAVRKSFVKIISYPVTLADVVNTNTKTAFLTVTIPGNSIADGDVIEMTVISGFKAPSGWNLSSTFRLEYGTDIAILSGRTWAGESAEKFWIFKVYLIRGGNDLYIADPLVTTLALQDVLQEDFSTANNTLIMSSPGFSSGKTLKLTISFQEAHVDCWIKPKGAKVIKITG